MSGYRDLERELAGLSEIRSILDAMRNLALLETRKIDRFLGAQQRCVETLAAAVADVASFHVAPGANGGLAVLVLLGSERGLCGDFNERMLHAWRKERAASPGDGPLLVALGARLSARLAGTPTLALALPGASVAEEVDAVTSTLFRGLEELLEQRRARGLRLTVLFHSPGEDRVRQARLSPMAEPVSSPPQGSAPRIHLPPAELLADLSQRHLVSRLQALLYGSLMAENEQRLRHMDASIRRLDESTARLRARRSVLRQEEITEEIEIIMLSAQGGLERGIERLSGAQSPGAVPRAQIPAAGARTRRV